MLVASGWCQGPGAWVKGPRSLGREGPPLPAPPPLRPTYFYFLVC